MERVAGARLTIVIGESDTGKTTLVRDLANHFLADGASVGIVDVDLGQSEIGPPTTVGFGRVVRPLERVGDAEVVAIRFVGVTSAARAPQVTVAATRRLVDRARAAGLDRVLVDTCGLVSGDFGRWLKRAMIEAVDPDVVVAVERAEECSAILRGYELTSRPAVVRLHAAESVRARHADERRRHRARALAAHFGAARSITLDLSRVSVHGLDERAPADLDGVLAGLEDRQGETLGLGIVRRLDVVRRTIDLDTPVADVRIASLAIGRERYGEGDAPAAGTSV